MFQLFMFEISEDQNMAFGKVFAMPRYRYNLMMPTNEISSSNYHRYVTSCLSDNVLYNVCLSMTLCI